MALAGAMLLASVAAAQAGPCSKQIAAVEKEIIQLQATPSTSGTGQPSAQQTVGAQLHHQPTPGSVETAQSKANADASAALGRASKADAAVTPKLARRLSTKLNGFMGSIDAASFRRAKRQTIQAS
jgi:hypothetical protein